MPKIGSEKEAFYDGRCSEGINKKLIYRHPHVFGDVKVSGASEVEENWEHLKIKENQVISLFFQVFLHHFRQL